MDLREMEDLETIRETAAWIVGRVSDRGWKVPGAVTESLLQSDAKVLRVALAGWASMARPQGLPNCLQRALLRLCDATAEPVAARRAEHVKAALAAWERAPYTIAVARGTVREVREMLV
jgi:hypothetical protein